MVEDAPPGPDLIRGRVKVLQHTWRLASVPSKYSGFGNLIDVRCVSKCLNGCHSLLRSQDCPVVLGSRGSSGLKQIAEQGTNVLSSLRAPQKSRAA